MPEYSDSRHNLILPDPEECPQVIAEAIYDIRNRQDTPHTHKLLQNKYGTIDFYMEAVKVVFEVNEWRYTQEEAKFFRKIYRSRPESENMWRGNAKRERIEAVSNHRTKWKTVTSD